MPQVAKCASDCACNAVLADLLSQMNRSGVINCGGLPQPELGPAALCLAMACFDCPCGGIAPAAGKGADGGNCAPSGGAGSSGNGQCDSTLNMTCNGTNYQIACSCPDAKCACFGPTSQVIPYSGCPYCPSVGGPSGAGGATPSDLFTQCGFP